MGQNVYCQKFRGGRFYANLNTKLPSVDFFFFKKNFASDKGALDEWNCFKSYLVKKIILATVGRLLAQFRRKV